MIEVKDPDTNKFLSSKLVFGWEQFFNQLQTQMQDNLSNDGYVLPPRSNGDISNLAAYIAQQIAAGNPEYFEDCRLLYNNDTNQIIAIKKGVINVIG
jgi:hypothetical protein